MSDPTDELMNRLAAADPIDKRLLPSPRANEAQQVLENTMSSDSPSEAIPVAGSADRSVRMLDLPEVPGARRKRTGRSTAWLAGAAAAVVLLIAGFLVFAPDNTAPALAAVHGAAQATAQADTGQVSSVFSLDGTDGTQSEQVQGRLNASFSGSNVAVTVDFDEAVSVFGLDQAPITDARLVDGVFYANDGGQWYSVEAGGFLGQTIVDVVDPRSILTSVQDLLETNEIGGATVDGVEVTQYRSIVDLGDKTLADSGWLALEGVDIDAEGEVVVDLYVDHDGLLRRLDIAGDVREPNDGSGSATFTVSTTFLDIGGDITVEAPTGAIAINPLDGFDSSQLFGNGD